MPKFESPLGSKSFAGQQLREMDVPDETGYSEPEYSNAPPRRSQQPDINSAREFQSRLDQSEDDTAEIEKQIRVAKEARRTGKERLNDGARKRIEMLLKMTRTIRQVELDDNIYIMQTLRSEEMREAIMAAAEFDGTVQSPFEIRRQLLSRSLVQVAGIEVAQFVGSDSINAKFALIDNLPEALLNRLFDEYQMMVDEARDKYALKNAIDAQEVVEDLKK